MKPGVEQAMGLATAVALLDLQRSGVRSELGAVPFSWLQGVKPSVVAEQTVVVPVATVVKPPVVTAEPPARLFAQAVAAEPAVLKQAAVANAVVPVQIWRQGEPGGVVVVRRADPGMVGNKADDSGPVLGAAEGRLLQNMLLALGLGAAPLGQVVLGGKQDVVQPVAQAELREAVAQMQPQALLVLGQAAVGTLAGQALGVEGWQAFAGSADSIARVAKLLGAEGEGQLVITVTYPLELLLARPLFKRLAWQHLQVNG